MAIIDPTKAPTLEEVNAHLLERLDELIQDADLAVILNIANVLAKLNTSSRNNGSVVAKVDEAEAQLKKEQEMFGHLSEADIVEKER